MKDVTIEIFEYEIERALKAYDKYVVCIDKTPDEFLESLKRLVEKAIKEYVNRKPGLRHGIALDKYVTVIISQVDGRDLPVCGIYFNLYSPYFEKRHLPAQEKEDTDE